MPRKMCTSSGVSCARLKSWFKRGISFFGACGSRNPIAVKPCCQCSSSPCTAAPSARTTTGARGATSTRSQKPITFIARAAAPTLPGWLVLSKMNRVGSGACMGRRLKSRLSAAQVFHPGRCPALSPRQSTCFQGCPMSQALHPMLNIAIKAARAAGAIINRASLDLDLLKVNTKSPNDFVTEVDQAAEQAIIEVLLTAYPGHGILAEESGRAHGAKDSDYLWIIDPLDGTTNFIHGLPVYAVSIALALKGQVQQAGVYDPTRND